MRTVALLEMLPGDLADRLVLLTTHTTRGLAPNPTPTPARAPRPAFIPAAPCLTPDSTSALGDFTWAQVVTLAAALIAAGGVIITLLFNAAKSRRDALATLYADALGAVAEYLEGPYRILRKDGTATTRVAIASKISDVKTAIDHNQALLRLHARPGVADAYDAFVLAAKQEAGKQMHAAWEAPPVTTDEAVNLNVALPRGESEAARTRLVEVMQTDLHRRWYSPRSRAATSRLSMQHRPHRRHRPRRQSPPQTSTEDNSPPPAGA